ncbi:MAG: hypothetical protein IJY34_02465, partial [Clostridia bacterium]|nr:hypothetical protein [Clostridia bacterium]
TVGGVGGLGYYFATQVQIKDAMGTVNNLSGLNLNYADYINEAYGDDTLVSFIDDVAKKVGKLGGEEGSLSVLAEISPLVGENVQKLVDKVAEYGIEIDYNILMYTTFPNMSTFLTDTVNGIEIANLVEKVTGNNVEGILAMICYGEEGEDYIVNKDTGEIKMLGTATSATIGSLTDSNILNDRLGGLSFQSLMGAMGGINEDDAIIRTLVYGVEDKDFVMWDHDNNPETPDVVHQLPKTYDVSEVLVDVEDATMGTKLIVTAPDGSIFEPVAEDAWANAELEQIIVIVDTTGTAEYQMQLLDKDSNVIYDLKHLDTKDGAERFQAYIDGQAQVRKGPYLNDVMGEDADLLGIVGEVRLGDLLDLNGDSDPIMLAVAYGEKGVDYTVNETTKEINPINPPITINDLMGEDGGMAIIEDIPLATLLDIESPLQENVESIMLILAFGEKDTHYRTYWEGGVQKWEWLTNPETGEKYSERTVGYLIENGNENLFSDLTIETLMGVHAGSDDLMRALAYGNENTHYILVDGNPADTDPTPNTVQMLPMRYFVSGTDVFDEEHIKMGTFGGEVESGIFKVDVNAEKAQYLKVNANGGYDVFATLELAQAYANDNDTRMYHTKTKLADLRGSSASEKIERIELAAALDVDIFGEGENEPDPLMVQLAFGTEGVHYDLDKTNKKINWYTDPATGLKYHARTIHDMKDTHSLMESIYLDTVLELNYQSPAIMLALAYGSDYTINSDNTIDGDRKTVGDLMGNNADALLKGIYLDTALEIKYDSPAIMLALAYGNDYTISGTNITYTTRNTLGDLMGSGSTDLINGIEMQKIITNVSSDDAMMNYILFNMTHPDPNASEYHVRTLGDFMNGSSAIIDGMMDALKLEEALGEDLDDHWILKHIKDDNLSNLQNKLKTLSVQQVLDTGTSHPAEGQNPSIYHYEYFNLISGTHLAHDAVYEHATNGAYEMPAVLVGTEYKAVYTEPVGDTIVWKLYGATNTEVESPLTGTWKYLLKDATGKEHVYALMDISKAMSNVADNIQKSTLEDLAKDKIIALSDDLLNTGIITKIATYDVPAPADKSTLGKLTVNEAVTYLSTVLKVLTKNGLAS